MPMGEEKVLLSIDLSTASPLLIELLIEDAADSSIFQDIVNANTNRQEILQLLLDSIHTPNDVKDQIARTLRVPVKRDEKLKVKQQEEKELTILQRVQKLSISEKILIALRGGREIRNILFRDPNKEVALTVLENPKITETEVELIARSRSIPDEALRKITKKREWMKNYSIRSALVTNPKTPTSLAIQLVSDMKTKDLVMLEKNKNVAEGVRVTAKRLLRARKGY
jgi:hypothetical protein